MPSAGKKHKAIRWTVLLVFLALSSFSWWRGAVGALETVGVRPGDEIARLVLGLAFNGLFAGLLASIILWPVRLTEWRFPAAAAGMAVALAGLTVIERSFGVAQATEAASLLLRVFNLLWLLGVAQFFAYRKPWILGVAVLAAFSSYWAELVLGGSSQSVPLLIGAFVSVLLFGGLGMAIIARPIRLRNWRYAAVVAGMTVGFFGMIMTSRAIGGLSDDEISGLIIFGYIGLATLCVSPWAAHKKQRRGEEGADAHEPVPSEVPLV